MKRFLIAVLLGLAAGVIIMRLSRRRSSTARAVGGGDAGASS